MAPMAEWRLAPCLPEPIGALARIEGSRDGLTSAVIVEADPGWHRGVLGIAASRLAREYHRPVLLFGLEGDRATGSGRSIPGVSLHGIMKELGDYFLEFGGHEQAAGAARAAESSA
jgi:single-stranded DNA-specific DHH superfamily exonuclease